MCSLRTAIAAPPVSFQSDVRPILAARCFECHGPDTQESGLRVDRRADLLKGGKSGRATVVPGKSEVSRLLKVVSGADKKLSMPPEGPRLTAGEIQTLQKWIDQGAAFDEGASDAGPSADFWSFKPVRTERPPVATHGSLGDNPIDAFIEAKLHEAGLQPSPRADRRTLIRRLYLDTLGLPPSPEKISQFESDAHPLAWNRLVERVLASPHFGERWTRHWLDVVRFAETDGFETNVERPNAYPYRDYLIRAFNSDKPYDRLVFEQLAGDAVGEDAATGFLVGGPCDKVKSPDPVLTRMQRQDELTDIINTTGTAFLGLTLGCAKCHNHKFDPIPQHDFYAVQAVFAGVEHGDRPIRESNRLRSVSLNRSADVYAGRFQEPLPVHRLYRGDPGSPREMVNPGGIAVVGALEISSVEPERERRKALASWIARPQNPLTARVMVNRLWHYHFGRGIVETPSDFGHNGGRPSHPQLLDWLAEELIRSGWSLKHVHRLILTSATYQQSSQPRVDGLAVDSGTRLLWRFPSRRLEAEAIRDSMLAASGALDERMGGPGFSPFQPNTNYVRVYLPKEEFGPSDWRRMVYMSKVRMEQDSVFGAFDCPDAGLIAPRRTQSTTAVQALGLFNSRFTEQQADLLAQRCEHQGNTATASQVRRAFELAFGRTPDEFEGRAAETLVNKYGLTALCRALFNANEFLFMP
jgi:hypothetical protein